MRDAIGQHKNPIIVDNTNVFGVHMKPYANLVNVSASALFSKSVFRLSNMAMKFTLWSPTQSGNSMPMNVLGS